LGYVDKTQDGIIYHNSNIYYSTTNIKYRVEKDHWRNYEYVLKDNNSDLVLDEDRKIVFEFKSEDFHTIFSKRPIILLELTPHETLNNDEIYYPTETIALTTKDFIYGDSGIKPFTTDFYLHGNSGIIDCQE